MKSTMQLALVEAGWRSQGLTVAVDPDGWLVKLKSTVPVGGLLVPLAVSLTVTVQPSGLLAGVVAGQSSTVVVERFAVTVTPVVPELPKCVESPPYVAVMVTVVVRRRPVGSASRWWWAVIVRVRVLTVGVYVTEQLAELPVPDNMQVAGENEPGPPLLVKATVPVGVIAVPESVSVTVAVQVVGAPTGTVPGEQLTLVLVVRLGGSATSVVPLLPACVASPP